jgi:hypothetical protein
VEVEQCEGKEEATNEYVVFAFETTVGGVSEFNVGGALIHHFLP